MIEKSELIKLIQIANTPFIDLQLFASAEDEGRTEEPSFYKIRKAREEGKVARSQELVSSLVLLTAFVTLWISGEYFLDSCKRLLINTLDQFGKVPFNLENLNAFLQDATWNLFIISGPVLLATVVFGVLGNVVQVGFMFSPKAMKVDFKKISFTANKMFSRIFFSRQTLVNLARAVLKVFVVLLVAYSIVMWGLSDLLNTIHMDVENGFSIISKLSLYVGTMSCLIFLVLSIPDYFYQRLEHMESLKMTRHETREERKDTEGDPQIRQRLRERQREIVRRRMMQEVPKADVVITNPTHYAVALKYDSETMFAPVVVAKGQDYTALKIKEIAIEHSISIIENKPLAQSLYQTVELGDIIPEEFYQAVAEVLAFVIRAREAVRG